MTTPFNSIWSSLASISGGKGKCKTIKKGGRGSAKIIGAAISTALVPFGLFATQKKLQYKSLKSSRKSLKSSRKSPKSSRKSPKSSTRSYKRSSGKKSRKYKI